MDQLPSTVYAKVSIMVPSGITEQRKPVDLVLVLNVRSDWKVSKNCIKLLTEAASIVTKTLGENDRLAILPVQPSLTLVTAESGEAATTAVSEMEIRNESVEEKANNENTLMTSLQLAESILLGRGQEDKENRTGHTIIISNRGASVNPVESLLHRWRFPSVHAFGFRDSGNARTMHSIASSRDCTYAILDDEHGNITNMFRSTVRRITTSITVEVKLKCEKNVLLSSIKAPLVSYFISPDKKACTIWASIHPDPAASVPTTNYIVELFQPTRQATLSHLLKVESVKYDQAPSSSSSSPPPPSPSPSSSSTPPPSSVGILHGQLPDVVVTKEVAAEKARLKAIKAVVDSIPANDNHHWEELYEATNKLRGWYDDEDTKATANSRLAVEMQEIEIRLHNNYLWREYILSWLLHQRWQLPLPPLFMDKQTPDEVPVQLEIFAKHLADGKNKKKNGVAVLVRVKVPETGLAKQKIPFVDVVVVLDVRRGAKDTQTTARERLEMLNEAMRVILHKLKHKDRLAIIPVQSSLAIHGTSLLEMTKQGKEQILVNIQSFVNLVVKKPFNNAMPAQTRKEQLKNTVAVLRNCIHMSPVGTTAESASAAADGSTCKLWKVLKMNAIQILDDRPHEEKNHRMGVIIVISDSDDNTICMEELSTNYNIHVFGFNRIHNARAMYSTAGRCNGIYDLLDDDRNLITEAFKSCINKITSIVVLDTEVDIICSGSNVAVSSIESGQFKSTVMDDAKSTISVGALHATAVKNFIFYMDNVHGDDHDNLFKLFTVHVRYLPTPNKVDEKLNNQLKVIWNGIDRHNDEEVETSIARVAAVKIITRITDPNDNLELVERLSGEIKKMKDIFVRVMEKMDGILYTDSDDPTYSEKLVQRLPWEMFLKVYEYKRAVKVHKERKEIAKKVPRQMFQQSKISNIHHGNHGYPTLMEESLARQLREMEVNLRTEIIDPNYYTKLVDRLLMVLSPKGSGGSTPNAYNSVLTRSKLALVIDNMEANLSELINDPTNNKQLVEQIVRNMCKSCASHARAHGEDQLAIEIEKMNASLGKEMVTMICREMDVPMYYKNLIARTAMFTCLTNSEKERADCNALYALTMEKMEVTLMGEMEKMEANPEHAEKTCHGRMVVLLVREMFLEVSKYVQVAGETRLSREVEDMEDSLLYKDITDADYPEYYRKLVDNKLSYMLSWLSLQRSCEQPSR